jgi:hypothetical protein
MRIVGSELLRAAVNAPNDHQWLMSSPVFQYFQLVTILRRFQLHLGLLFDDC